MTQPFTSDDHLLNPSLSMEGRMIQDGTEQAEHLPDSAQPAIVHPNFDPKQTPLDPARSLSDIPEPARKLNGQLRRLYGRSIRFAKPNEQALSKWRLIGSEALAEHLALLRAAGLIDVPDSFYHNYSEQPLLSSLTDMTLIDSADIQSALQQYPTLSRYGIVDTTASSDSSDNRYDPDELLNSLYANDWQVILHPEQFETGAGSLATDIVACSLAVHVLRQCDTRKSINQSYSAEQICQHMRSYLLSQLALAPMQRQQYRQIRLFSGHVIVAAHYLGFDTQVRRDGTCYFNLSSRCRLLTRYANISEYYINGWQ